MRKLIVAILILLVAAAGGLSVVISGWPSIVIRNRQYRELIVAFQSAQKRDRLSGGDNAGWVFQVQLADRQTSMQVNAFPQNSVKIKYDDEAAERELYRHVDYSSPIELRTAGDILYVYWGEIMLGSKYWLLTYDVRGRREISRRRVDPGDLAQSH